MYAVPTLPILSSIFGLSSAGAGADANARGGGGGAAAAGDGAGAAAAGAGGAAGTGAGAGVGFEKLGARGVGEDVALEEGTDQDFPTVGAVGMKFERAGAAVLVYFEPEDS